MKVLGTYAPFGVRPCYYAADGSTYGATIREVMERSAAERHWDVDGVRSYLNRSPDGWRTCFAGIHAVPPGHELVAGDDRKNYVLRKCAASFTEQESLVKLLESAVAGLVSDGRRAAVALSGGLDSALLVAILRRLGRDDIPVVTLASGLAGYCERQVTAEAARRLGVKDLQVIETSGREMIEAFPSVIAASEVPLFNLHPVSRWLLATALHREGYEVLLTGDGADPIFAGSDPRNYLPIIGSLTRAAGMELRSPFFDERIIAAAPVPAPGKPALREAARHWLPDELIHRPKTATYAPALDVSDFWKEQPIRELARKLHASPPSTGADAGAVLWTSLGLLAEFLN